MGNDDLKIMLFFSTIILILIIIIIILGGEFYLENKRINIEAEKVEVLKQQDINKHYIVK